MRLERSQVLGLVLHFRTPQRTLDCLQSLVREGIRAVVLVDNSEDGGASLNSMSEELQRLRAAGMGLDIVSPDRNLGFAKGVNTGLARALASGAKAILLINSDARLGPGSLEQLLQEFDHSSIRIPRVREASNAPSMPLLHFYHCATALLLKRAWHGCLRFPSGCCMLIPAPLAGPRFLDEDFFFYGEDVMLGRQLRDHGVSVRECPGAVVFHAGAASARRGSLFYEYHVNRGHLLLARKLAPGRSKRIVYIACRCITLPMRASLRSMRFRSLLPWRGLITATADVAKGRCRSLTPPAAKSVSASEV